MSPFIQKTYLKKMQIQFGKLMKHRRQETQAQTLGKWVRVWEERSLTQNPSRRQSCPIELRHLCAFMYTQNHTHTHYSYVLNSTQPKHAMTPHPSMQCSKLNFIFKLNRNKSSALNNLSKVKCNDYYMCIILLNTANCFTYVT